MALATREAPSIGQLNVRVDLQARVTSPIGGLGGTSLAEVFTTIGQAWCSIVSLRGGRYIAGRQVEEVATHRITLRWRNDYQEWGYILAGTQRFRIQSVTDPNHRRRWLELLAEEVTP